MFINILPSKTRLKIQFQSMLRRYTLIWGLAGMCALAYASIDVWGCWQSSCELVSLETRCQPLYALQQEIHEDRRQLERFESQCAVLGRLQPSNHFLDLLGVLVHATRTEPGKLHVQRLTLQSGQGATAAASPSPTRNVELEVPSPLTFAIVTLNGLAEDDAALTQFVAALRRVDVFEQVDLKASTQVVDGSRMSRTYQLECRYEELP